MTGPPWPAGSPCSGIRHHGPGSARSVLAELDRLRPAAVLIEGPADADPLLALAADPGMVPPVALLAYAPDAPRMSAFWPFAVFSPEWQALAWAAAHEVPARFCDLPAAMVLRPAARPGRPAGARTIRGPSGPATAEDGADARTAGPVRSGTRSRSWPPRPGMTTRSAGGTT